MNLVSQGFVNSKKLTVPFNCIRNFLRFRIFQSMFLFPLNVCLFLIIVFKSLTESHQNVLNVIKREDIRGKKLT